MSVPPSPIIDAALPRPAIAIETSQRSGSVALLTEDGTLRSEPVRAAAHGDDLVPALDRLCSAHGVEPRHVRAVAVDIGPGGFTGLRVGVAAAKLIAETTGALLVGVPAALVIVAEVAIDARFHEAIVLLAVKPPATGPGASTHAGTAWLARLRRADGASPWRLDPHDAGSLVRLEPGTAGQGIAIAPEIQMVAEAGLLGELAHRARSLGVSWVEPAWSAAACMAAAARFVVDAGPSDPARLVPIYPRPAEAVTLWERRAGLR